ncbi:MAG: 1-deoxy-D-xylulose-5-phosphate reductoisomerase [Verrucomicrobia bacterium]|jgi:1-deoxy-D-xylulose-5-phosphate reductoisomerase|nr:MAG: 1-deoxy-D-xylulose-5-phosphate reductoisomerase [Verrucomicrobiota bacterium]
MSAASRKRVLILGSTGSIGTSALKVARDLPDRMEIVGMAAATSADLLAQQAAEFPCRHLCLTDPAAAHALKGMVPSSTTVFSGQDGLSDLVRATEADLVLVAIVGTAGLKPALTAIACGCDLAVASKEILVMAGRLVMAAARSRGVRVLPVDSEHNAIFQCLDGRSSTEVRRLILTASGGPFRTWSPEQIAAASLEQALKHPTWNMGRKITIDSATLFNKGLEMIEARWLFDVEMARVDVVVHPQSIVHSMVEFSDSSVLAQLSRSDMCFPIQYAVTYPDRVPNSLAPLDFPSLAKLDFEAPRRDVFPALDLAVRAGTEGGTLPAVFNAANEIAVAAFLDRRIAFPKIWQSVARVMDSHQPSPDDSLDAIIAADSAARLAAARLLSLS